LDARLGDECWNDVEAGGVEWEGEWGKEKELCDGEEPKV